MPSYNWGLSELGITISTWIKPHANSSAQAHVLMLSTQDGSSSLSIRRHNGTDQVVFTVASSSGNSSSFVTGADTGSLPWQTDTWTHIAVVLAPLNYTGGGMARWKMYVNGNLTAQAEGLYPDSVDMDKSYFGTCEQGSESEAYVGHIDSFVAYALALTDDEITVVYLVRLCVCVRVCVYIRRMKSTITCI
jgi:hypothetical protein